MKTQHPVPKVGDVVCLNNTGLETLYGTVLGHSHMKTLHMKITSVEDESITAPEETFVVTVDNPDINRMMIDHWCFDIVRGDVDEQATKTGRIT